MGSNLGSAFTSRTRVNSAQIFRQSKLVLFALFIRPKITPWISITPPPLPERFSVTGANALVSGDLSPPRIVFVSSIGWDYHILPRSVCLSHRLRLSHLLRFVFVFRIGWDSYILPRSVYLSHRQSYSHLLRIVFVLRICWAIYISVHSVPVSRICCDGTIFTSYSTLAESYSTLAESYSTLAESSNSPFHHRHFVYVKRLPSVPRWLQLHCHSPFLYSAQIQCITLESDLIVIRSQNISVISDTWFQSWFQVQFHLASNSIPTRFHFTINSIPFGISVTSHPRHRSNTLNPESHNSFCLNSCTIVSHLFTSEKVAAGLKVRHSIGR